MDDAILSVTGGTRFYGFLFTLFDQCTPEGHFTGESSGMRATAGVWFLGDTHLDWRSHRWSKNGLGNFFGGVAHRKKAAGAELGSGGVPIDLGETLAQRKAYTSLNNTKPRSLDGS